MTRDDELKELKAESEYLRIRERELEADLRGDLQRYGLVAGRAITRGEITPELLLELETTIVSALVRSGHRPLADSWLLALRNVTDAIQKVTMWNQEQQAALAAGDSALFSDSVRDRISQLKAIQADALEQFEQVEAEVRAVLDATGAKEGE